MFDQQTTNQMISPVFEVFSVVVSRQNTRLLPSVCYLGIRVPEEEIADLLRFGPGSDHSLIMEPRTKSRGERGAAEFL